MVFSDTSVFTAKHACSERKLAAISFQVTLFPNQGFCIGITINHTVMDAKSAFTFINAWAYACRHEQNSLFVSLPSELIPFIDRTIIKDPTALDVLYLNQRLDSKFPDISDPNLKKSRSLIVSQNFGGVDRNLVRATFQLTRDNIKQLRKLVPSEFRKSKETHFSTFVLTMAYTVTCMVKAREGDHMDGNVVFLFSADYRNRLNFPENYFGNCIGAHMKVMKRRDLVAKNGFGFAADKFSEEIQVLKKGDVLSGAENKLSNEIKARKDPKLLRVISVSGSPNLNIYGSDFGWGRPKKVEVVSIDRSEAISLVESGDGSGGVEIGLAFERLEMEKFASFFKGGLVQSKI